LDNNNDPPFVNQEIVDRFASAGYSFNFNINRTDAVPGQERPISNNW